MPITMDYSYDFDTQVFVGAQATVQNESLHVETSNGNQNVEPQPIKMKFVDFQKGNGSSVEVEYVDAIDPKVDNKVQVPLALTVSGNGNTTATSYAMSSIRNQELTIQGSSSAVLNLDLMNGHKPSNGHLLTQSSDFAKYNLKMEFEYAGK